jgi:regulator of replication initiation timing
MMDDMDTMRTDLAQIKGTMQSAVSEAAALRTDNETLRGKIARLENQNERLTIALGPRESDKKKKD